MSYIEATVVIDGSLAEVQLFDGDHADMDYRNWLDQVKAASDSELVADWAVYRLDHHHPVMDDVDCECIQHVTDLRPVWTTDGYDGLGQ